uniref:Putative methyltransferase PMT3 n=1 Tax=Rhizophora mucronata TaxID=61149 RepID=A0A2P2ISL9_RHIMU
MRVVTNLLPKMVMKQRTMLYLIAFLFVMIGYRS